MKQGQNMYPN